MNIQFIVVAYLSLLCFGFLDNSRGPFYPQMIADLGLNEVKGSLLFSLSSFTGLLVTLWAKKWVHFGALRSVRVLLVFQIISFWMLSYSDQFLFLYFSSAVFFGISAGGIGICMNVLILEGSPVNKQRQFVSGLHSIYGLASLFGPLIIAKMYELEISWQTYFRFITILPVLSLFSTFTKKRALRDKTSEVIPPWDKRLVLFAVCLAVYVSTEVLVSSRLVYFLSDIHGMDPSLASRYLVGFFSCLFIGRVLMAFYRGKKSSYFLLVSSSIITIIFSILLQNGELYAVIGISLSMSLYFPVMMSMINSFYKEGREIVISRIMIFVGSGLIFSHYLYGLISEQIGQINSFKIIIIYAILNVVLLLMGRTSR